uniref:Antitoxin ParD1/3/4 n=1 Tax=Candidatus Kentrum sp. MB TaxID=2138164 RepID=A0A450XV50_9GAMM|nr:MAG: hypothetical protein BECKMB1821G_GA0114241_10573 [Candidatus Kentron sp. MB]VFK33155.1 MAG: hypothetical protein BECKMB1821I_GA0114274_10413 [Candidatus Kentron sp. MB]VFK76024.1 MAG: hypothetical protein BECKMB1821H_GA0114242_10393 [Candidatus Kentron sp. MB]
MKTITGKEYNDFSVRNQRHEIIREALRDRQYESSSRESSSREQKLRALRIKIQQGLADVETGRVHGFDAKRIIEKGEQQLQSAEVFA